MRLVILDNAGTIHEVEDDIETIDTEKPISRMHLGNQIARVVARIQHDESILPKRVKPCSTPGCSAPSYCDGCEGEGAEGEGTAHCPACSSKDLTASGLDADGATVQCNACDHKWTVR